MPKASRSLARMLSPRQALTAAAIWLLALAIPVIAKRPTKLCSAGRLGELLHRLQRAVRLHDGEEDVARTAIVVGAIGQGDAAQIEAAGLGDGLEESLARRLAVDLLQRRDHQAPDHIALERDETRHGVGLLRLERRLIAPDHADRRIVREGHD